MRTLLILLLLAVIAFSMLTRRRIIEGKKNKNNNKGNKKNKKNRKKFNNEMSKEKREKRKKIYGVSGRADYAKAMSDQEILMKKLKSKFKGKKDFRRAFIDVYQGFYKRKELRFDDDGRHNPSSGAYGQYQEAGVLNLKAFRNGGTGGKYGSKMWYDIIYELCAAKAVAKKQNRDKKERLKHLFGGSYKATRLATQNKGGDGGISDAELESKLADYATTSYLENDYTKTADLEDIRSNAMLEDDSFYKTFILTQNQSGIDTWLGDDTNASERRAQINAQYEDHIRFFGSNN